MSFKFGIFVIVCVYVRGAPKRFSLYTNGRTAEKVLPKIKWNEIRNNNKSNNNSNNKSKRTQNEFFRVLSTVSRDRKLSGLTIIFFVMANNFQLLLLLISCSAAFKAAPNINACARAESVKVVIATPTEAEKRGEEAEAMATVANIVHNFKKLNAIMVTIRLLLFSASVVVVWFLLLFLLAFKQVIIIYF